MEFGGTLSFTRGAPGSRLNGALASFPTPTTFGPPRPALSDRSLAFPGFRAQTRFTGTDWFGIDAFQPVLRTYVADCGAAGVAKKAHLVPVLKRLQPGSIVFIYRPERDGVAAGNLTNTLRNTYAIVDWVFVRDELTNTDQKKDDFRFLGVVHSVLDDAETSRVLSIGVCGRVRCHNIWEGLAARSSVFFDMGNNAKPHFVPCAPFERVEGQLRVGFTPNVAQDYGQHSAANSDAFHEHTMQILREGRRLPLIELYL